MLLTVAGNTRKRGGTGGAGSHDTPHVGSGVTLSWLLVHSLFTLRYATIYYRDDDGVDFNEKKPPRYGTSPTSLSPSG